MVTKADSGEILDLLIERGPKLRKAGFSKVSLEGVSFELLPLEPEIPKARETEDEEEKPRGPLDDPDTYGRKRVPRLGANS
jgi:hypothetical protein